MNANEFLTQWTTRVKEASIDQVMDLYHEQATLLPTFAPEVLVGHANIKQYFVKLGSKDKLNVRVDADSLQIQKTVDELHVLSGFYTFEYVEAGQHKSFPSRFTFIVDLAQPHPILHHHSSLKP